MPAGIGERVKPETHPSIRAQSRRWLGHYTAREAKGDFPMGRMKKPSNKDREPRRSKQNTTGPNARSSRPRAKAKAAREMHGR